METETTPRYLEDCRNRALSVMGRAAALLDSAEPDTRPLGQCRWELARALRAYQIDKHRLVFDPAIVDDRDRERVRLARQLKADCIAMGERFREHLLRWSATSVADAWSDYRPAAQAMIAQLRVHIERECRGIVTLAEWEAGPRPRAAPVSRAPRPGY